MIVGLYYRKFFFFAFVGLLVFGGVRVAERFNLPIISASIEDNQNMSEGGGEYYLEMNLMKSGAVTIGNKKIKEGVKPESNYDELRYIVLDQPDENYVDAEIVLNLPTKINRLYQDPKTIAVHGASSGGALLDPDGQKITFRAYDIGNTSSVTIIAQFPKGYLELPATQIISGAMNSLSGWLWLAGGIALPPIAVIILMVMFFRSDVRSRKSEVTGVIKSAPSNISPALASIVYSGRVGEKTLMAMLVDLATRDYIEIFNRGDDFVIYKKEISVAQAAKLRPYEKVLIEKIFMPKKSIAGAMDVEARLARHLYSRKIAAIYLSLYVEGESLGYFTEMPAKIHLKYRILGIAIFFLGLLGFIVSAFIGADPKFILFFWLSLVVMGSMIVNLAPRLTAYSKKGRKVQSHWLKFRNFLTQEDVIRGWDELFEQYLPYAIAMDCEADWAARFVQSTFVKPDWYDHVNLAGGVENFVKSFWPVVDTIAESLNVSSEPLVR
jgi:hypothetical protein